MRLRSRIAPMPGKPSEYQEPPAVSSYHVAERPAKDKPSIPNNVGLGGSPARPTPTEACVAATPRENRDRSRYRIPRTAGSPDRHWAGVKTHSRRAA
jgi:hypothetical protein